MSIEQLTAFFAWCSLINIAVLMFASISLMLLKNIVPQIHSKMFAVDESELRIIYFQYLAHYKIAIFIFSLVPYLALRIVF